MMDPLILIVIILLVAIVFVGSHQGFSSVFNLVIVILVIALLLRLLGLI
jgi:uncharacterized membrane protein